jgi:hypothetical protein
MIGSSFTRILNGRGRLPLRQRTAHDHGNDDSAGILSWE